MTPTSCRCQLSRLCRASILDGSVGARNRDCSLGTPKVGLCWTALLFMTLVLGGYPGRTECYSQMEDMGHRPCFLLQVDQMPSRMQG